MIGYDKATTISEKWTILRERLKDRQELQDFLDNIEELSENPNYELTKQIEKEYKELLSENILNDLNEEDREILEENFTRFMLSGLREEIGNNQWELFIYLVDYLGVKELDPVLRIIEDSEELNANYESSHRNVEGYTDKQSEFLKKLDKEWVKFTRWSNENLSTFWHKYFNRRIEAKRELISHRIERFQDNAFGEWLRAIRAQRGWSLHQASDKLGVSTSYVHRLENGSRATPSVTKLKEIAEGYNVPLNQVIAVASGEIPEAPEFIKDGVFTINGKEVSDEQRKALSEIIEVITDDLFDTETSLQALEKINKFRKTIE